MTTMLSILSVLFDLIPINGTPVSIPHSLFKSSSDEVLRNSLTSANFFGPVTFKSVWLSEPTASQQPPFSRLCPLEMGFSTEFSKPVRTGFFFLSASKLSNFWGCFKHLRLEEKSSLKFPPTNLSKNQLTKNKLTGFGKNIPIPTQPHHTFKAC